MPGTVAMPPIPCCCCGIGGGMISGNASHALSAPAHALTANDRPERSGDKRLDDLNHCGRIAEYSRGLREAPSKAEHLKKLAQAPSGKRCNGRTTILAKRLGVWPEQPTSERLSQTQKDSAAGEINHFAAAPKRIAMMAATAYASAPMSRIDWIATTPSKYAMTAGPC